MSFMHVKIDTAITIGTCVGFGFLLLGFYKTMQKLKKMLKIDNGIKVLH